ncbi:MAG: Trp family transcriptional regulator [bacterium]|nr:Trp family transcriptional regulator [bacterium]
MTIPPKHYRELYELFAALNSEKEAADFLKDILTPQELDSVVERWQEVQLLAQGVPQRKIAEQLGISISKITRGSRALQYGTGGLKRMLKKMKKPINIAI